MSAALNFKSHLSDLFAQALREVAPDHAGATVLIERPKQTAHGDYACNLAMQLAKPLRKSPRDIAQALIAALPQSDVIEKLEIAGAGFINVFITTAAKQNVVRGVLQAGESYGHITLGAGRKVGVEFVSANPTEALHVRWCDRSRGRRQRQECVQGMGVRTQKCWQRNPHTILSPGYRAGSIQQVRHAPA